MSFYVYENWTHTYCLVHHGDCRFCNHGRGNQGRGNHTANGRWHRGFDSANDATEAAQRIAASYSTRQVWTVRSCHFCAATQG